MRERRPILRPRYGESHASAVAATLIRPRPEPEVAAATPCLADVAERLAERVGRLSPSRHDPEGFFEERDEIRGALVRMARELRPIHLA